MNENSCIPACRAGKERLMENFIHDKQGYCFYATEAEAKPLIFNLYTKQKYRRQGFARKHIEYVINEIRKTGYGGEIEIEVNTDDNSVNLQELASFYRRMGLKILGS